MSRGIVVAALALGLLSAAGCAPKPPPLSVNASMTQVMAVNAQTIWDITSSAFNAKGDGLDAAKISQSDWAKLGEAGEQLRDRANLLAKKGRVIVAVPGETIMGQDASGAPSNIGHEWDAASSSLVQARIDADPALFAQRARILADAGDAVVKASKTGDVAALYNVSSNLDEVCDGCHQKFWGTDEPPPYPK